MSLRRTRRNDGFPRVFPAWLLALRFGVSPLRTATAGCGLAAYVLLWGFLTIEVHGKTSLCLKDHASGFLVSVDLLSQFG